MGISALEGEREACKALVYELNRLRPEERPRIPDMSTESHYHRK